jgi:hypothetical protein
MFRLLVSKIQRHGQAMFKVKLIETNTGESFVLDKPILTLDELQLLEQNLAKAMADNNKIFISKNFKP